MRPLMIFHLLRYIVSKAGALKYILGIPFLIFVLFSAPILIPLCLIYFVGMIYFQRKDKNKAEKARTEKRADYTVVEEKTAGANENSTIKEWRKAAENGNADAAFNLGYAYERGSGVAREKKTAMEWYKKAGDQGHKEAQKAFVRLLNS